MADREMLMIDIGQLMDRMEEIREVDKLIAKEEARLPNMLFNTCNYEFLGLLRKKKLELRMAKVYAEIGKPQPTQDGGGENET